MENDTVRGCGPCATRRNVLAAAGAAGAVGLTAALSGCAVYGDSNNGGSNNGGDKPAAPPASGASAGASAGGGATGSGGGAALAKTSDIPVGGGKIFGAQGVVVTQPQAGNFKAF